MRKKLLNPQEVADLLGVGIRWVYKHTARGCSDPLPVTKVGGYQRFDPDLIATWIEGRTSEGGQQWTPDF